jgi:hypothetical protein
MIQIGLQRRDVVELQDRGEGIVRRHQLFVRPPYRGSSADASPSDRGNLSRCSGECVCESFSSLFGETRPETEEDNVSDHR